MVERLNWEKEQLRKKMGIQGTLNAINERKADIRRKEARKFHNKWKKRIAKRAAKRSKQAEAI